MSPPRDMPDNYPWLPGSPRAPLVDLGELAARLGSPVVYDRRGEVVWWDDGQWQAIQWKTGGGGAGTAVAAVQTQPLISPYAIQLTAGSNGDQDAYIERAIAMPEITKVGIEAAIAFTSAFTYFLLQFYRYDGTTQYQWSVQLHQDNGDLNVLDGAAGYTTFAALGTINSATVFYNRLKMVVDLDTGLYDYLSFNYEDYDLSAYEASTSAVAGPAYGKVRLYLNGDAGFNRTAQVGCAILTANEP